MIYKNNLRTNHKIYILKNNFFNSVFGAAWRVLCFEYFRNTNADGNMDH